MSTLLKKLSVKAIVGAIVAPPVGEMKELAVIIGFARDSEIKNTSFGDSTGFMGDFKGINVETGEEFRAGKLYLPDVAENLLANALASTDGMVEFGFKVSIIGVKGRNEGETGKYEYRCEPLMKAAENDPLDALESRIKQGALPAPESASKESASASKELTRAAKLTRAEKKGGK